MSGESGTGRAGQADVDQVVYFGSRLGALVAAAASRPAGAPLACWNAPITGAAYFNEIFRILRVGRLAGARTADGMPGSKGPFVLRATIGCPRLYVGSALYESAATLCFADELGPRNRTVRLVEIGDARHAQQAAGHVASLRERGFDVTASVVEEARSWWLDGTEHPQPEEGREAVGRLVEETAAWLAGVAGDAVGGLVGEVSHDS